MSKPIENFFLTNFFVIWIKAIFGAPPSKLIAKNTVLRQPHLVYNDLLTASDSGSVSIRHLLDLSAAFDTIDHNILLTRLENTFGVCDLAVSFFCSHLQGRTQAVTVNEVKSSHSLLTCGVPPGLRLGDQYFSFCILDLFLVVISHHPVSHRTFADGTGLYKSDSPPEAFTLAMPIQSCISDVKVWAVYNKLQLNGDKAESCL